MLKSNLYTLKGKEVVVRANGIVYTGILLDVSEENIFLRHSQGHSEISMDRIQSIRPAGEKTPKLTPASKDHFEEMVVEKDESASDPAADAAVDHKKE